MQNTITILELTPAQVQCLLFALGDASAVSKGKNERLLYSEYQSLMAEIKDIHQGQHALVREAKRIIRNENRSEDE